MKNITYKIESPIFRKTILPGFFLLALTFHTSPLFAAGKWGFINHKGEIIIQAQYDYAGPFSDQRAAVKMGDYWGFIDTSGNLVIPAGYAQVYPFKNGVTSVKYWGKPEWYLINTRGETLGLKGFSEPLFFSEGLAPFKENGKTGYVDTNGNIIIEPTLSWGGPFSDGLAAITLDKGYAFINKSGKIVIPGPFQEVDPFVEGYAHVKVKGLTGNIDKTGKFVIPPEYSYLGGFSEGLAQVRIEGKWGYFNISGKLAIKPKYQFSAYFKDGLAKVTIDNKSGYIDHEGKVVVPLVYDSVDLLGKNALRAVKNGVTLYLKFSGEPFSSISISWMANATDGYHLFKDDTGKWGFLSEDGTVAVSPVYLYGGAFGDGLAPVQIQ